VMLHRSFHLPHALRTAANWHARQCTVISCSISACSCAPSNRQFNTIYCLSCVVGCGLFYELLGLASTTKRPWSMAWMVRKHPHGREVTLPPLCISCDSWASMQCGCPSCLETSTHYHHRFVSSSPIQHCIPASGTAHHLTLINMHHMLQQTYSLHVKSTAYARRIARGMQGQLEESWGVWC